MGENHAKVACKKQVDVSYQYDLFFARVFKNIYNRWVKEKKLKTWNGCPVRYGTGIFGDKWSLLIIRDLMFKNKKYYGDFFDSEEEISTNILADRLVKLEQNNVIRKTPDPNHRSRFIYSLTGKGLDLIPMMLEMVDWAEKYDEETEVPKEFIESYRKNPKKFASDIKSRLEGN